MSTAGSARTPGYRVWRKSSFSEGNNNDCVEVAHATATVGVRDSKNSAGPSLFFAHSSWHAFLGNITPTT